MVLQQNRGDQMGGQRVERGGNANIRPILDNRIFYQEESKLDDAIGKNSR